MVRRRVIDGVRGVVDRVAGGVGGVAGGVQRGVGAGSSVVGRGIDVRIGIVLDAVSLAALLSAFFWARGEAERETATVTATFS